MPKVVTFGEIMLRLSPPGFERFFQSPVLSATDGVVVRINGGALGGNAVFVLGPGGRTYYYAHLSAYAPSLTAGLPVRRGELIGYVGSTGNARGTSPHLHFGVYTSAGAVNPYELLRDEPVEEVADSS